MSAGLEVTVFNYLFLFSCPEKYIVTKNGTYLVYISYMTILTGKRNITKKIIEEEA